MSKLPILENKSHNAPSVFVPGALIREARRQKRLSSADVPRVCILDPDGDIVRWLRQAGRAEKFGPWPCYHSDLYTFALGQTTGGVIGCAVGAPFAVLVAEELFACGCQLLLSVTSAGQITNVRPPPYFVIIDKALRDEGCSYHYAAGTEFANAAPELVATASKAARKSGIAVLTGSTWTTDAPFRETAEAIAAAKAKDILAVEMEAAALYTFARAANVPILCLAHVTNSMGLSGEDFEKGEAEGAAEALRLLEVIAAALLKTA